MGITLCEDEISISTLSTLLDEGAISHRIDDDGDIYVNEFASPYWILIDTPRKILRFFTYIQAQTLDEAALLKFANRCNENIALIQFSYSKKHRRFFGSYQMPYRSAVLRTHVLWIAREFPRHFNHAVNNEDHQNLFELTGDDSSTGPADDAPRLVIN